MKMIQEIKTIQDVSIFASQLVNQENLNFHPDDDFSVYINLDTKESLYSEKEILFLNQQMKKCFDVCDQFGADIYELMGKPLFERMKIGDYH